MYNSTGIGHHCLVKNLMSQNMAVDPGSQTENSVGLRKACKADKIRLDAQ